MLECSCQSTSEESATHLAFFSFIFSLASFKIQGLVLTKALGGNLNLGSFLYKVYPCKVGSGLMVLDIMVGPGCAT